MKVQCGEVQRGAERFHQWYFDAKESIVFDILLRRSYNGAKADSQNKKHDNKQWIHGSGVEEMGDGSHIVASNNDVILVMVVVGMLSGPRRHSCESSVPSQLGNVKESWR